MRSPRNKSGRRRSSASLALFPLLYELRVGRRAAHYQAEYSLAAHDTFDPVSLIGVAMAAGIEQANNTFRDYGQGASGYAKRFGAKFADGRTSDFFSHAVFPSIFHQDPRYFYQGSGSFKSRLAHAVGPPSSLEAIADIRCQLLLSTRRHVLRGPLEPVLSLGGSRTWSGVHKRRHRYRGGAGSNILREFFSKHVTSNVPGNGKP